MGLKLITPPTEEPVSLADAKNHLRVPSADDDLMITDLISRVRRQAERELRRPLVTQTWEYLLDKFPVWTLELPLPPLQSIVSITYVDVDGSTQTVASVDFKVDTASVLGRVTPAFGKCWPVTRDEINAVTVRFVAGFGLAASVPQDIKQWMLLQVGHWYENREAVNVGNIVNELPFVVGLIDSWRVPAV